MKKSSGVLLVLSLLVFSTIFVSASWYSDLFNNIFGGNTVTGNVVSENIYLEQQLRGPSLYADAAADCQARGMRLPTWQEASWDLNTQVLPEATNAIRLWTSNYCYEGRYSGAYAGLRQIVESGVDAGARYGQNNCLGATASAYYQCVATNTSAPVNQTQTCTSFNYSSWSTCNSTGIQTRTVLASSPSGCTGGNPVTMQSCNYTAPVQNNTCVDSDGGLDYETYGTVITKNSSQQNYTDTCFLNSTIYGMIVENRCTGTSCVVKEGYCTGEGSSAHQFFKCPGNCFDGACGNTIQNQTINVTCTDSDGGSNYYLYGQVYASNFPSSLAVLNDSCVMDNITSGPANSIIEGICNNNGMGMPLPIYHCPNGCLNGACVNSTQNNQTNLTCADSDGGDNTFIKGMVNFTNDTGRFTFEDFCHADGNLIEFNCRIPQTYQNDIYINVTNCSNGCSDGACINRTNTLCSPIGNRFKENNQSYYCAVNGSNQLQMAVADDCENNYECRSNFCSDGKCITNPSQTSGLIVKIWCKVSTLFSGEEAYESCLAEY